jgi:hypothetical protein
LSGCFKRAIRWNTLYQKTFFLKEFPDKARPQTVLKELLYLDEDSSQQ